MRTRPAPPADAVAVDRVLGALRAMHGRKHWHWQADSDPFEVALGAILVQNTSWVNAERALESLRSAGLLTPCALGRQTETALEDLLRPSGQFRQKARKVRAFLDLVAAHGGLASLLALPAGDLRETLLATWGIGPETADCIALYSAHQPTFVVDAYTVRLFTRLGHGPSATASYAVWQQYLASSLPVDAHLCGEVHALVVIHGRDLCRKRAPRCGDCLLRPTCLFEAASFDRPERS